MAKETCCHIFIKFLINYVAGLLFWLPISIFFAPLRRIQDKYTFEWFQQRNICTWEQHRRKVDRVQEQIKKWNANGRKQPMVTGRPAWNSLSIYKDDKGDDKMTQIELGHLNCAVDIDETNRTLTAEPSMMIGQLTSILIPRGWTIPVVPGFEALSIGGVICGAGLDSSSTTYGLIAETVIEYEVVLSNGTVVNCSKSNENSDLFHAIPWSRGTLGFLTVVKFPLIPAKKFVRLEYHLVERFKHAKKLLGSQDHQFVEGLAFGLRNFVVMYGNMCNEMDASVRHVNNVNRWYKPFFYKHVQSFIHQGLPGKDKCVEFIPLRDYYHRHTRGWFWEVPVLYPYANNVLFRVLFGWIFPRLRTTFETRLALTFGLGKKAFHAGTMDRFCARNHILQDFILPFQYLESAVDFVHDKVKVYPIWLCPCKFFNKPGMTHSCRASGAAAEAELFIDVGVHGNVHDSRKHGFQQEGMIRRFEAFMTCHDGVQGLYADSYLTRTEFRRMYDMKLYDEVRAKYECLDAFPDVYDKRSKSVSKEIQV